MKKDNKWLKEEMSKLVQSVHYSELEQRLIGYVNVYKVEKLIDQLDKSETKKIIELENELNKLNSYIRTLETNYNAEVEFLEIELEKQPKINQFYWFTSKTRPPAHVVYSNRETQLFGFNEPPQYKFIEHHDLRFITHATLDELIEQFR